MSIVKKYQAAKGNYKVTFSYPASEGISQVQVLGDFNNWDTKQAPKLKKGKEGFSTTIELNAGNAYEFKYFINGSQWDNDQQADRLVPAIFGSQNSLVTLEAVQTKKAAAPKAVATKATKTVKAAAPKTAKPAVKAAKPATAKATVAKKAKVETATSVKTVKVVAAKPAKKAATKPKAAK